MSGRLCGLKRASLGTVAGGLLGALALVFSGCTGSGGDVPSSANTSTRPSVELVNQLLAEIRAGNSAPIPEAHRLRRVPGVRQKNAYLCVIASTKSMLGYWGVSTPPQEQLAQRYAKINSDSSQRRRLAGLAPAELRHFDWNGLGTTYVGLQRYLNQAYGDQGKVYNWEYAGSEDCLRNFTMVKALVAHNVPVLVAQKQSQSPNGGHSVIVVGYSAKRVWVMNPTTGSEQALPLSVFLERFKRLRSTWITFVRE